jgi:RNA polymerase sigma factor (sigma-70 family)
LESLPIFQERPGLLVAFREGDRNALESVYRYYVSEVLRLLRSGFTSGDNRVRGIPDSQRLLDAVQEVFVRAFGDSGRLGYDGVRPYRAYLLRIAQNLRIDELRKSGREVSLDDAGLENPKVDLDTLIRTGQAVAPLPDTEDWLEAQGAVRAYVATLDDATQRFIELRFVEELGQIEVASRLGVTRRRVRTMEARVLSGLRRALMARTLA